MKNKSFSPLLYAAIAVFFMVAAFFIWFFSTLLIPAGSDEKKQEQTIEIPGGTSTRRIAEMLSEHSLIRSEFLFYAVSRYPFIIGEDSSFSLKSGVYSLDSSMNMKEILQILDSGKQAYIKVSFPEGLTVRKISNILEENKVCSREDFFNAVSSEKLLAEYGIPSSTFEGFLFPDTYFFTPLMTGEQVVSMMADNFFSKIEEFPSLKGKSVSEYYEDVVLASIVEREYRIEEEAPLIASTFRNRLDDGAGLYSCATIEYIITEIQGKPHPDIITYDDLKIDSPYNTYKWAGLTPTPISNPGLVALDAAVNTPKTDYYYFTLTDAERGSHEFSTSLRVHTQAGQRFKTKRSAD